MSERRIRVLVVDDSAVVRRLVKEALSNDSEIEVVGTAVDPYAARDRILELKPDVLTLDIEMPRMDGLTFLRILMRERPMPVVVMSSLTAEGSVHALEALRLGAVDILAKPGGPYSFGDLGPRLLATVKAAARARLRRPSAAVLAEPPPASAPARSDRTARVLETPELPRIGLPAGLSLDPRRVILIGSSTGGTEALREILPRLPAGLPPIVIVQHIPQTFSKAFADRLNSLCAFSVKEACHGDVLTPGMAVVAPGNYHLLLQWAGGGYRVIVRDGPQVWHQRPAVDVMMKSIAETCAPHAVAGILTGMGRDGADGLARLRRLGATTFAQDEASCVVYGMPRAAWENGAAQRQLALDAIPAFLVHALTTSSSRPSPAHVRL